MHALPFSDSVNLLCNPSQATLREMALAHTPAVFETACGNLVKLSRNKARMAKHTYIIAPESDRDRYSSQVMERAQAEALIARQQAYIVAKGEMIEIQGYLGLGPRAVPVQWLYTVEGANIAGMQQVLAFPPEAVLKDGESFLPQLRVVYTPNFMLEDRPGRQVILVDLHNWTTYIMGPDYFGESKKAALRMLNAKTFAEGGLVLHAGAKAVQVGDEKITMTIKGLSGTGKTTTTFSKQGTLTQPIQDDMVAIWPEGELSITENGCFAKTYGLNEKAEPVIFRGTVHPTAWLENVYTDENGALDFDKGLLSPTETTRLRETLILTNADPEKVDAYIAGTVKIEDVTDAQGVLDDGWEWVKWTQNGRSIIPMASVDDAADLNSIAAVKSMGILNRDEGADAATPGILRFTSPEQAAGYFMLGETTKTSAAGKEVGKTRSPFTQPFFPLAHGLQAKRFSSLAATMPEVGLWMMNTGYVGGSTPEVDEGTAFKVKIRHSSAMLEALLADAITWTVDPDFGYEVVDIEHPSNAALLEKVPADILRPSHYYKTNGRENEYATWVGQMKAERRDFLKSYDVDTAIIEAVTREPELQSASVSAPNQVRAK
jgi:phosphoenolpyruvate carboxykinase (ATP)